MVHLLESFSIVFSYQLTFSLQHLVLYISTAQISGSCDARFQLGRGCHDNVSSHDVYLSRASFNAETSTSGHKSAIQFSMRSGNYRLLWCMKGIQSSEWNNEADRAQWREFPRSFSTMKTIRVYSELIDQSSRSLLFDDRGSTIGLLPEPELEEPRRAL